MTESEIQSLLAKANNTAGEGALSTVDAEGNSTYTPETAPKPTPTNVPDEDGIIKATKPDDLTPEQAIALMDKIEGKAPPADPDAIIEEEIVEEDPVDFDALTLDEKIAHLQEQKDKEAGIEKNPLAEVDAKLDEANIEVSAMEREFIENGELSAESLASLKKAGFDDTAIEAYITTKVAQETAKSDKAISDICGSKENFTAMSDWMTENLSEGELDRYNKGVQGEHYQTYLENMYNKYTNSKPATTRTVRQKGAVITNTASDTYASTAEMVVAIQNPRYKNDVEYRNSVIRKVQKMK